MADSIDMIRQVAVALGEMKDEVVFVGGTVPALLITDPAGPEIRPTQDVDVLVELVGKRGFYQLEEKLRKKGFQHVGESVISRMSYKGVQVDIMPTDTDILGFSNRWYPEAFRTAKRVDIEGMEINLITAPLFLATKLEAFKGRGENDFYGSHDLEDIIALIDGREELLGEIQQAREDLQAYLAEEFSILLKNPDFLNAGPAHLPGDRASQQRWPGVLRVIQTIAAG